MDIALSGLAAPLALPAFGRGRSARTGPEQQNGTATDAANRQTARDTERSSSGRILRGEVLSSHSESAANTYNHQRGDLKEGGSSEPGFRRFSLPAAIQAFRENEALVADQSQPRQVSGIIDEYV